MNIDDLNEHIRNCRNCRLSETRTNALCGQGNLKSKIMLIAQAPGEREDQEGRMFIGPSGHVLNDLLAIANIDRNEIYMTNLVKCRLPKNRRPKQEEIEICSHYLKKEIQLLNPKTLVPLGYHAMRFLFEKNNIVLPPKEELATIYGKIVLAGQRKILPVRHPAALLYNDSLKDKMVESYRKMKVLLSDCKWFPACPLKSSYEDGDLDRKWIELYCLGDWEQCVRYHMEDEGKAHPDWMLPDGSIDEKLQRLCKEP